VVESAILEAFSEYRRRLESSKDTITEDAKAEYEELLGLLGSISITDLVNNSKSTIEYFRNDLKVKFKEKLSKQNIEMVKFIIVCLYYEFVLKGGSIEEGYPSKLLGRYLTLDTKGDEQATNRFTLLSRLSLLSMRDRYNEYTENLTKQNKEITDNSIATATQVKDYSDLLSSTDKNLKEYINKAGNLRSKLNFLILSGAFTDFIEAKEKNVKYLLRCLMGLGVLLLIIPLYAFGKYQTPKARYANVAAVSSPQGQYSTTQKSKSLNGPKSESIAVKNSLPANTLNWPDIVNRLLDYLPLAVAELFLLFYFRIILTNYNSANAQLLQLKMRQSVCQFIEDYTKFKKDKKADELEKFESLIFSNLMPSAEQIPSTFEGLDHLGKILGEFKPKKD